MNKLVNNPIDCPDIPSALHNLGYFANANFPSFKFTQGSKYEGFSELIRQNVTEQLHFVPK